MRIYISGPITNTEGYRENFNQAYEMLKRKYPTAEVVNPAILSDLPLRNDEYMELDLLLLDMCDSIFLMNGWDKSKGACIEYGYAMAKNLTFL